MRRLLVANTIPSFTDIALSQAIWVGKASCESRSKFIGFVFLGSTWRRCQLAPERSSIGLVLAIVGHIIEQVLQSRRLHSP